MIKEIELLVSPDYINDYDALKNLTAKKLIIDPTEISAVKILRRSIDARRKPVFRLKIAVLINENLLNDLPNFNFKPVISKKNVLIIGSGPAGLFAALRLIELGIKPIIIERGKNVRDRRFDIKDLMRNGRVNNDSNYCFGEGGAGTYSDGKLYTRSNKRGDVKRIINLLIHHGANEDIRIDSHPHIGSNKLPKIISGIRETVLNCNGEINFESRVTDFVIQNKNIKGVIINENKEIIADAVILAPGHSARDIYGILSKHLITVESKPFAVGVRIEHPQLLIDAIQYKSKTRHENLPASSYNLTCQIDSRGVYTFCMCPGGIIVPASTAEDELVLNGMSVSKRNSPFANSGLVVEVNKNNWQHYSKYGEFAGLEYQKELERSAYCAGGGNQVAAAQRATDFVSCRISSNLPKSSYIPGTISAPVHEILPHDIVSRLKQSLLIFNKKMRGFFTEEAQILAVESRTSSPLRILRDKTSLMHIEINGLFPAGEGAGYAGGIISAAVDGERCADAVSRYLH
jgi:uncharacterized FAD-dependent dehydrogenase